MNCARCKSEIVRASFTISVIRADGGGTMVINLCRMCIEDLLGKTAYNGLMALVSHAGWVQPPLPLI